MTPYEACEALRQTVLVALSDAGSDPVTTTYTGVGLVAWDDCCGQLVVTPERVYRYVAFPIENTDIENCDGGDIAISVLVTLVRCVPTPDDSGDPPTAASLAAAHADVLNDAAIVWDALVCDPLPSDWERAAAGQTFVGGEGGCIAIETRLTIGLDCSCWQV